MVIVQAIWQESRLDLSISAADSPSIFDKTFRSKNVKAIPFSRKITYTMAIPYVWFGTSGVTALTPIIWLEN